MPRHRFDPLPRKAPTPQQPVTANRRTLPANAYVPLHTHTWAQLACTLAGAMRVSTPQTAWIVPPGRAVWIPPRIAHDVATLGELELRTVHMDPGVAPLSPDACEVLEMSGLLRELVEALTATTAEAEPRRYRLASRLMLDELRRAPRLPLDVPLPQDRRLKALCEALLAEPAASLTLGQWAARVGASERTLARLFRDELGMSFGHWRSRMRLAHAAVLISRGEALADVAASLGYESASAFTAMFRRFFGAPPRAVFRRGGI